MGVANFFAPRVWAEAEAGRFIGAPPTVQDAGRFMTSLSAVTLLAAGRLRAALSLE